MASTQMTSNKQNALDMFINGARRGFTIATTNMLPNVLMAFVLIRILNVTGLLDIVGATFRPVMALWGLPGEGATVLLAAVMSMGGGIGVAAGLYTAETLSGADITILIPGIYLMGSLVQFIGRCLGTAEVNTKYFAHMVVIAILNALLAMWVMRVVMAFF